jgi:hypothetical protein
MNSVERIQELNHLLDSTKNLLNEHIRNQIDSLRALTKALISKESSERMKSHEEIMKTLSMRIEAQEKMLRNKIDEEVERLNVTISTFKDEFKAMEEATEKHFDVVDSQLEENSQLISDHYEEHKEAIFNLEKDLNLKLDKEIEKINNNIEIRGLLNSMTEHLANEERKAKFQKLMDFTKDSLNEMQHNMDKSFDEVTVRMNSLETAITMDNMINRAAIDGLDEKYEQALEEVASSIDNYIGVVNDTSNKQYEDFNKNLKSEFGKNLEQIQDILNNLRDEIDGQKEKVNDIEVQVNDIDVDNKKNIDKVNDQIEIQRIVNAMVSWVSEEKDIQKFEEIHYNNHQLTVINQDVEEKADSALEGLKELESKREKDLKEIEDLRQQDKEEREKERKQLDDEKEEQRKKDDEDRKRKEEEDEKRKQEEDDKRKREEDDKRKREEEEKRKEDEKRLCQAHNL